MIERIEVVDSDSVPVRSRSMVAIGASSTGLVRDREARIGDAEGVDPADFRIEADDLAEGVEDAEQQHADDEAVEARIVQERTCRAVVQDRGQEADERQEDRSCASGSTPGGVRRPMQERGRREVRLSHSWPFPSPARRTVGHGVTLAR